MLSWRSRRLLAPIAALVVCATAPAADAAPSWRTFDAAVAPGATTPGSFDAWQGHAAVGYTEGSELKVAERLGGESAFERRTVSAASPTHRAVVVDRDGGTVAAWTDATGLHVRTRGASGDFGATQDLSGDGAQPVQLAALGDGAILAAQSAGSAVKVWRQAPGGGPFNALADVPATAPETIDSITLRAGRSGGAALAIVTRQTTVISEIGGMISTTERVRVARLVEDGPHFGAAEDTGAVAVATTMIGMIETADLKVSDVQLASNGVVHLGLEQDRSSLFMPSADSFLVVRRTPAGTWSTPASVETVSTGMFMPGSGALGQLRLVSTGEEAVAIWSVRPPGSPVDPAPVPMEVKVARSSLEYASPVKLAVGAADAPIQLLDAAAVSTDRSIALLARGTELRAVTLDAAGTKVGEQTMPGSATPASAIVTGDGSGSAFALASRDGFQRLSLIDPSAPVLSGVDVPVATVGQPVRFAATAADSEGAAVEWDLGDGRKVSGSAVDVTYPTAGARTVKVTATDPSGNTASAERTVDVRPVPAQTGTTTPGQGSVAAASTADTTAPALSAVKLSRKRFAVDAKPTALAAAPKPTPRGTVLSWQASEAGRVLVGVERSRKGWKSGARCAAKRPSGKRGKKAKRCTRVKVLATIERSAAAGAGSLAFSGTLGTKALAPGAYRFAVVAVDAAGNRSKPSAVAFTVVKAERAGRRS